MVDLDTENLLEISDDEKEIASLYGSYVDDKKEKISIELKLEQLAESVMQKLDESFVANLDYSDESLESIEQIINSAFQNEEKEYIDYDLVDTLSVDLGAYLALTIMKNFGGEFRFRKDLIHSSIYFGSIKKECFPFHKVIKRLLYGESHSLLSFYNELIVIMDVLD
ncbi:MAG: hypothetical protein U0457_04485 [Candidatus Sericytochromatia bacterium]